MKLADAIRNCILTEIGSNKSLSHAAIALGVSRRKLYRLIEEYRLDMHDAERWPRWNLPGSPDQKARARATVAIAVSRGLKALPCERCQSMIDLEAHHEDYSKPMAIVWLCSKCHRSLHDAERSKSD